MKVDMRWERALIPLSLLILVVARFAFNAPLWVLAVFCLWIPLYYLALPLWVRRKWQRFEKTFALRFQKGQHRELIDLYRRQWLLRRYGPKSEMLGKLALVYMATNRYREAEVALERAIKHSSVKQKSRMGFNLANIKFELGKYEEAAALYEAMKAYPPFRQTAETHLALIDIYRGQRVKHARKVLEEERRRAPAPMRKRIDEALSHHAI